MTKSDKEKNIEKDNNGLRLRAAARVKTIQKIEKTSLSLFSAHGFEGTTIRMIAEKTGISLGLMYNYFSSKDALMKSLVASGIKAFCLQIDASEDKMTNGTDFLRIYFKEIEKNKSFFCFLLNIKTQSAAYKSVKKDMETLDAYLEKKCKKYFDFSNTHFYAQLLSYLDGLALHFLYDHREMNVEKMIEMLIAHITPKNTAPPVLAYPQAMAKTPRKKTNHLPKLEDEEGKPKIIQTNLFD